LKTPPPHNLQFTQIITQRPLDPLKKLNLGCGNDIHNDMINLDIRPFPGVDLVHDINYDWPFLPDRFQEIHAHHILEHAANLTFQMNQAWRILEPHGLFIITVPWFSGGWAHGDPGHRLFFDHTSFDPFSTAHDRFINHGIKGPWLKKTQDYIFEPLDANFQFLKQMGISICLGMKLTLQKP